MCYFMDKFGRQTCNRLCGKLAAGLVACIAKCVPIILNRDFALKSPIFVKCVFLVTD